MFRLHGSMDVCPPLSPHLQCEAGMRTPEISDLLPRTPVTSSGTIILPELWPRLLQQSDGAAGCAQENKGVALLFFYPVDNAGECCECEFHRSEGILSTGSYKCTVLSFIGLRELSVSLGRRARHRRERDPVKRCFLSSSGVFCWVSAVCSSSRFSGNWHR